MAYTGLGAVASPTSAFYFRPSTTQWQNNVTAAPKPVTTTAAPKPVTTTAPKTPTITALPKAIEPVAVLVHPTAIDRVQPGMQPTAQTGGGPTTVATSVPVPQPSGGGPSSLSLVPNAAAGLSLDNFGDAAQPATPSWLIPVGLIAAVLVLSRSRHKRR